MPSAGQGVGGGDAGRHRHLVLDALRGDVERRRQVEDDLAVLDGDDAARGERPPVADAVDVVEDGRAGVAGAEEVRVQRMHDAALDGAACRNQRLAGDLSAEDVLATLTRALAAKDVLLDGFEVEQGEEAVEGGGHAPRILA